MTDDEETNRPMRRVNRRRTIDSSGQGTDHILAELGELENMLALPESKEPQADAKEPKAEETTAEQPEPRKRIRAKKEKQTESSPKKKGKSPIAEEGGERPAVAVDRSKRTKREEGGGAARREKTAHELQVCDYINAQNRPYSLLNIFDNLRGKIKKADLQKALDSLVAHGDIVLKEGSKPQVYWAVQKSVEINPETLRAATEAFGELKERLDEARSLNKTLKAELHSVENAPSTESLEGKLREIGDELPELQRRIDIYLQRTTELLDRETVSKKQNELEGLERERNKRKKILKAMIDGLLEATEMPKKKLLEKIGIEL